MLGKELASQKKQCEAVAQAAQGGSRVIVPEGVQEACGCGSEGHV